MRFLNASVLERKALNRNLSWGFLLGNLLPKTHVLKHRVLERKRRPNANASVLGTQRSRTLSPRMIGCSFFAYSWKLPAYSGACLLTIDNFLALLLVAGAFLLTVELLYLQLKLSCLQWECASNKGLKGLQAKKLNCKQKTPTASKKASPEYFRY